MKPILTLVMTLLGLATCFDAIAGPHPNQTNVVTADGDFAASLEVLNDSDGGAYALLVHLVNTSTNDFTLRFFDFQEMVVTVGISASINSEVKRFAKPYPDRKPFELHFVEMNLKQGKGTTWFVRLQDRLALGADMPDKLKAVVGVGLHFTYRVRGTSVLKSKNVSGLHLYQLDTLITKQSLAGNAAEKYDKTLTPEQKMVKPIDE